MSTDDADALRERPSWGGLLLAPFEAILGTAIAVSLHVQLGRGVQTTAQMPVEGEWGRRMFDESECLDEGWADKEISVRTIFSTIHQIVTALEVYEETEVAVHALMLVERLIRKLGPSFMRNGTLRPVGAVGFEPATLGLRITRRISRSCLTVNRSFSARSWSALSSTSTSCWTGTMWSASERLGSPTSPIPTSANSRRRCLYC